MIRFIRDISRITSDMSNGKFDERIKIRSKDELGLLASSVNKMADYIISVNATYENKLKEQTKSLTKSNERLNQIFDITPNITIITDGKRIIKANNKFFEFTESNNLKDFLNHYNCFSEMFFFKTGYLEADIQWVEHIIEYIDQNHKVRIIKNKQEHNFLVNTVQYTEDDNEMYIVVFENITELQKIAYTDKLTSLANRMHINEVMRECIENYIRYKNTFTVILLDIDYFKAVNDAYGHLIGDEIIQQIAYILKKNTRSVDLAGRWGGEEFILILKETNLDNGILLAKKICKIIEFHDFKISSPQTVSLGVAQYQEGEGIDELMKRTDDALYDAKNNGRNRVEIAIATNIFT